MTVTDLVRHDSPLDVEALAARIAELEAVLGERQATILRLQTDLGAFRLRYRREVGLLHDELDALEGDIAALELGEFARRLDEEGDGASAAAGAAAEPAARALTSDAVRRLFRDVAKAVHPDLAGDEAARDRRHRLMVEANRAYALGDEERLRSLLQAWQSGPDAVQGDDPSAVRERLARHIAQLDNRLEACDREIAALEDTPLYRLKSMVDEAAARGKDLVAEQVRRLKRDIVAARNRLDAMRL